MLLKFNRALILSFLVIYFCFGTTKASDLSQSDSSNLIQNNPFVPKAKSNNIITPILGKGGLGKTKENPGVLSKYIQFKSVAIINKKRYFSLFNKRTNKSFWIPQSQAVDSFTVKSFNPNTNSITITDGINTESIAIIASDEKPLQVVTNTPTPKENNQKIAPPPTPKKNPGDSNKKPIPRRRVVPIKKWFLNRLGNLFYFK